VVPALNSAVERVTKVTLILSDAAKEYFPWVNSESTKQVCWLVVFKTLKVFFTFLNHIRCAEDALQACFMSPANDTTMAFQRAAPTKLSGVHKGTSSSIMEISLETEKGTINTIQYIYQYNK